MADHFMKKCRGCGAIVAQCRCPDPNKRVEWVESCSQCPASVAATVVPALSPKLYTISDTVIAPERTVPVGKLRALPRFSQVASTYFPSGDMQPNGVGDWTPFRYIQSLIDAPIPRGNVGGVLYCYGGCGRRYEDFGLDVILPTALWNRIAVGAPFDETQTDIEREGRGGVLCAQCIIDRLKALPGVTVALLTTDLDAPPQFDRSHDQEALCADCGHAYYRHFDWADNYRPGCKYCDCTTFRSAAGGTQ